MSISFKFARVFAYHLYFFVSNTLEISFDIMDDMECQGDDILNWSNGDSANNGAVVSGKGEECISICESHEECSGFVHDKSTNECTWKTGSVTTSISIGKTCYTKKGRVLFLVFESDYGYPCILKF